MRSIMSENRFSVYLDCFTFGAQSRRIFYAIILEGMFLLGTLRFTSEGLLDTSIIPQFNRVLSLLSVTLVIGTFLISRSVARDSFSPILHTRFVPSLIALGYLALGMLATGVGYLAQVLIFQTSPYLTTEELWIGVCIGLIFGFLILFYYDRHEIKTPRNHYQFGVAAEEMLDDYRFIQESEQPPIKLTAKYQALEESTRLVAELLKESTTLGGMKLSSEMRQWVEEFSSKPESAKDRIVGDSGTPQQEELNVLRNEFNSIIKRVRRIANQ